MLKYKMPRLLIILAIVPFIPVLFIVIYLLSILSVEDYAEMGSVNLNLFSLRKKSKIEKN